MICINYTSSLAGKICIYSMVYTVKSNVTLKYKISSNDS